MESSSSSPGVSPVIISNCIEHLLHFTLSSSIDETLEFDLGLTNEYCSNLLINDPNHSNINELDSSEGHPSYPLYKRLASALYQCLESKAFVRNSVSDMQFQEDESFVKRIDNWNKLFYDNGYQLINMLKAVDFELHVQEPYFSQLRGGMKTIEGRCAVGNYNRIQTGALLLFNKRLLLEVQNVERYASFAEMLEAKSLERVLPGAKSIEEGVQIYRKFYTDEKEKLNGVVAISVSKPDSQPYITMASIVSELSYEGISSLLGLMHTSGTAGCVLPPPKSALLSSFLLPHEPTVRGSKLTEGARALAKHVNRASSGWWGNFDGNDFNKNLLALGVINHLITHCSWINIHYLQPDRCVLEIRVSEGYGARWSKDGSKFLGFLEPHMEDGHLKRWKH
ncbi:Rna-binding asch domain protein [Thalictrum thalictroides]|uniref:Rna-binding asch domain protein n=1 Tax=Thalictrum thalictroides TaxID=46969 RepID=A0A7J6VW15_THATH|nr:Rna-binding asch domain protein [Thalictrum thalictroides]